MALGTILILTIASSGGWADITVAEGSTSQAATDHLWNPAVLGTPWAADFRSIAANEINVGTDSRLRARAAGDGRTDDTAAVTEAMQLASSSGGGTVYFPPGDYKIVAPSASAHGRPLVVPSRVILRGSSPAASRIFLYDSSAANETDYIGTWGGIDFRNSSLSGMTDLGIRSVNSSTGPCAVLWNRGSSPVSEVFFNNLDVHLGNCRQVWFERVDKLLVQNSRFESEGTSNGPIYLVKSSDVAFLKNRVTYHFGRVQMQENSTLLVQGNILVRDAQNKDMEDETAIESGGIELSFARDARLLDNTLETLNAPADESNDGEAITTQHSNIPDFLDAGSATAISSTSLTDTSALWDATTVKKLGDYPGTVIAIFTGRATGEIRTIQSIAPATKTLTVTQAWDPMPEVGASYSIFRWSLQDAVISGNKLINNPNGIVLWDGCYNCTVSKNTLNNSRGIQVRSVDELMNPSNNYYTYDPKCRRVHQLTLNVTISNNVLNNTSGARPSYITVGAEAFAPDAYRGLGIMNVRVKGNTIHPFSKSPSESYDPRRHQLSQEGFFPCYFFGPAAAKDPITTVFRNIVFVNNRLSVEVTYLPAFAPYAKHECVTASPPPND